MFESRSEEEENDGSVSEEQLKEWGIIEDGPKELTEQAVNERFRQACIAGYRGDLEKYSRDVLKIK